MPMNWAMRNSALCRSRSWTSSIGGGRGFRQGRQQPRGGLGHRLEPRFPGRGYGQLAGRAVACVGLRRQARARGGHMSSPRSPGSAS
eukprot:10428012-Heterocapsa_arctica.AAC.1